MSYVVTNWENRPRVNSKDHKNLFVPIPLAFQAYMQTRPTAELDFKTGKFYGKLDQNLQPEQHFKTVPNYQARRV